MRVRGAAVLADHIRTYWILDALHRQRPYDTQQKERRTLAGRPQDLEQKRLFEGRRVLD